MILLANIGILCYRLIDVKYVIKLAFVELIVDECVAACVFASVNKHIAHLQQIFTAGLS